MSLLHAEQLARAAAELVGYVWLAEVLVVGTVLVCSLWRDYCDRRWPPRR